MKKILIVRNDKIGDFVLSLPAIKSLKQSCPDLEISVLVPEYTQPIASMFSYIDQVLIDDKEDSVNILSNLIESEGFDAVIVMYSTFRVAWACRKAGIRIRIAPATKIFQWCYNYRLKQRRSESIKPEFEYNKDLVRYFIRRFAEARVAKSKQPYLKVDPATTRIIRSQFIEKNNLDSQAKIIMIHPGSGGSAKNLSKKQYSTLAKHLHIKDVVIVFTAGPNESELINEISSTMSLTPHVKYESHGGLESFVEFISIADCFIGGSTGPLHIAGALNVKTVGFYPNRKSATSLRWQTLSDPDRLLNYSPPGNADEEDMESIDVVRVAKKIKEHWPDVFSC